MRWGLTQSLFPDKAVNSITTASQNMDTEIAESTESTESTERNKPGVKSREFSSSSEPDSHSVFSVISCVFMNGRGRAVE